MNNSFKKTIKYIESNTIFRNQKMWTIINMVVSIIVFIFCIATILSSTSVLNTTIVIGFVYVGYLISAISNIFFCLIIIANYIFIEKNNFYRNWIFYFPCAIILIESVVLPIPLNHVTRQIVNSGVLWSILIFAFLVFGFGLTIFMENYINGSEKCDYIQSSISAESDHQISQNNENTKFVIPEHIIHEDDNDIKSNID